MQPIYITEIDLEIKENQKSVTVVIDFFDTSYSSIVRTIYGTVR